MLALGTEAVACAFARLSTTEGGHKWEESRGSIDSLFRGGSDANPQ